MYGFCAVAFFGSLISGGTALGIDTIFTPILLIFGVNPKVAKATGMYMTAQYSFGVLVASLLT